VTTSQNARGRRSAEQARATRAALVELAADLFAEHGYIQTSIRDISRHGAVTSGAIYGHFRNKAELLAEAINTRIAEQLEADTLGLPYESDYIETLTRAARRSPKRRRLRALLVQGAAAAQTDEETRNRLREEQLSHIKLWIQGYKRDRVRLGIDPSVDIDTAVLYTWAVELGLGVLESVGIEPRSAKSWADIQNRLARSLQLPPDGEDRKPPRVTRSSDGRPRTPPRGTARK
jgi:AcrR family transcriptional regulator